MLLLAVCLHCANSSVSTAKEGESPPIDCSSYILRPEDVRKMTKCIDQAIIQQIIANITAATNKKMTALESELPKMKSLFTMELKELRKKVQLLEKKVNSSRWHYKLYESLFYSFLPLLLLSIRSSGLSGLEEQRLP